MATFEELKQRYMFTGGGGGSSASALSIPIFAGCQVQTLIDAPPYYGELKSAINALGAGPGNFIYLCGWWYGHDFSLDGGTAAAALAELLIAKSKAGVDVRVLGWVLAPEVLQDPRVIKAGAGGILGLNGDTMAFIQKLRTEPTLTHKAALNILAHPAGAAHLKMGIVGTATQATGFTGGLDLQKYRYTNWRDVQTRVSGPAAQVFFDAFRSMWAEVKGRSPVRLSAKNGHVAGRPVITLDSHSATMPDLPARTVVSTATKKLHVQPARTLPRFNFPTTGSLTGLPKNQPLSFAPNGLFEVRAVWEKAIKAAQQFIYIEDQSFTSFELFDWINAAVKAVPELRVVLLTGQGDPNDPATPVPGKLFGKAVNDHLLAGLGAADQARIGLFRHRSLTIHSKTTIIDDQWALVGSANAMRRSLYTDFEHSVAFMDEDNLAVLDYRASLWGNYFSATFVNPQDGLARWFAIPYPTAGGPPHSSNIERLRIPFTVSPLTADEQVMADEVFDCDSRDVWGDDLVRLYMRQTGAGSFAP